MGLNDGILNFEGRSSVRSPFYTLNCSCIIHSTEYFRRNRAREKLKGISKKIGHTRNE